MKASSEEMSLSYTWRSQNSIRSTGLKAAQAVKRIKKSILLPARGVEPLERDCLHYIFIRDQQRECSLLLQCLGGNDFQVAKQRHNVKGPRICDL